MSIYAPQATYARPLGKVRTTWICVLLTFATLLLPKAIGVVRVLLDGELAARHGGRGRFAASVLLELAVSALYAPVTMLMQSRQLLEIVLGRDSGWGVQRRDGSTVPWSTVISRHWMHTLVGAALAAGLLWLDPVILPWMAPILVGLLLAIPLSRWSGSERIGRALRARGLLTTPDERTVPREFHRRERLRAHYAGVPPAHGSRSVLLDPVARERHYRSVTPPPERAAGEIDVDRLVAESKLGQQGSVDEVLGRLAPAELMCVLGDVELCRRLDGREGRDGGAPLV